MASGGLARGRPHPAPVLHLGRSGGALTLALLPADIAQVDEATAEVLALHVAAGASASLVSAEEGRC